MNTLETERLLSLLEERNRWEETKTEHLKNISEELKGLQRLIRDTVKQKGWNDGRYETGYDGRYDK